MTCFYGLRGTKIFAACAAAFDSGEGVDETEFAGGICGIREAGFGYGCGEK